jgi:hypothetical protein
MERKEQSKCSHEKKAGTNMNGSPSLVGGVIPYGKIGNSIPEKIIAPTTARLVT